MDRAGIGMGDGFASLTMYFADKNVHHVFCLGIPGRNI